jgi:uncharacterized membrane protein YbaN (DUF454 family)
MTDSAPARDYSQETRLANNGLARFWYLAAGHVSVVLAVLGIFLPLLPTTPFLLLAAACYARGSVHFYNWLLNSATFGPIIRNWREDRSVELKHKIMAIVLITISIGTSVIFFVPNIYGKIALSILGLCWITVMLRIPTRRRTRTLSPGIGDSVSEITDPASLLPDP